jgi:hypothetical protein
MHRAAQILVVTACLAGAACHQGLTTTESKLVGDWSMPRGHVAEEGVTAPTHGFDVTSFKADHTFSQTAHPVEAPPAHVLSGSWRVEADQLVMKFTWAHPTMQEMVGQELRLIISDLQQNKFVSVNSQNQNQRSVWTRVK